jgi:Leucine-rich repeat (LRR) protein
MEKIYRKYNSEFRKNLKQKIAKLTSKYDYLQIYKIIISELDNKISSNRNGIYFNLNILSDDTIDKINLYLNDKIDTETNSEFVKVKYETYNKDNNIENFIITHKLTNQEKTLIKKYRMKDC